jgi:phosphate transport system substrate-binding protein
MQKITLKTKLVAFKYFVFVFIFGCVIGCKNSTPKDAKPPLNDNISGTLLVAADESFKPVIEAQIKGFENLFDSAKITAQYKSEVDCIKSFLYDSATRMAIITRGLTKQEHTYFKDAYGYPALVEPLANDAVAIIVHHDDVDSLFTKKRLLNILLGKDVLKKKVIFDGNNATSTFRYIADSILRGSAFDTNVVQAVQNSSAVIDYVGKNKGSMGFVGISWIGNPEKEEQLKLLNQVTIAYVRCELCEQQPFVRPEQFSIHTNRYPLVRTLYFITKDTYSGLGNGFGGFMKYEKGQLIFKRAYLDPKMDFTTREVKISVN